MKHTSYSLTLLSVALLFSLFAQAQELPIDSGTKKISYTEVVDAGKMTKAELYSAAREWFSKTYNSANAVLQMDDKETGKLIGKAHNDIDQYLFKVHTPVMLHYTISLYLKDNKYKYEITDLAYQYYPSANYPNQPIREAEAVVFNQESSKNKKAQEYADQYKANTIASMESLIKGLKAAMVNNF